MTPMFRHDSPDRCVVGTVGEPGQRTFFLQARSGSRLTSVVLEKMQVAALVDRLESLLADLAQRLDGDPSGGPAPVDDLAPLDLPLEEEFRVESLSLGFEAATGEVEIVASAAPEAPAASADRTPADPADVAEDPDAAGDRAAVLVVRLTDEQARAFVRRARAVVAAGRPPCPLCAQPLDPSGHICPRQNGFRRRR
jgi:uncharacterized repeat protein (TIGR03847 family)